MDVMELTENDSSMHVFHLKKCLTSNSSRFAFDNPFYLYIAIQKTNLLLFLRNFQKVIFVDH